MLANAPGNQMQKNPKPEEERSTHDSPVSLDVGDGGGVVTETLCLSQTVSRIPENQKYKRFP